jgi:GNAT superfamily N-acetyltransferase
MIETIIRPAEERDIPTILDLIRQLALFEKAPEKVENTEAALLDDGFGPNPVYTAFIAERDGQPVGFTLSYIRYSTWRGKVLYLEDIFVPQKYRGLGVGKKLMQNQIDYARTMGYPYVCFQVLDWNQSALDFYKPFGAEFDSEWVNALIPVSSTV